MINNKDNNNTNTNKEHNTTNDNNIRDETGEILTLLCSGPDSRTWDSGGLRLGFLLASDSQSTFYVFSKG